MVYDAQVVIKKQSRLGEGPVWSAEEQTLYYVDIENALIYRYMPQKKVCKCQKVKDMVGCVVLEEKGGIVAAVRKDLEYLDQDLNHIEKINEISLQNTLRFNDGKCDAYGRLWVGVMSADQSLPDASFAGALYCVESGKTPVKVLDKMAIPNGMAWSADNRYFYHIDTATGCVQRYDYNLETGIISNPLSVIQIPKEEGSPDGMCIDTNGNLWIALWGGYKVVCCDPTDGRYLAEVHVPAKYVSCCTFGGKDMKELFITSAMDEEGKGGELYSVCTDVQGTLPFRFKI